MTVLSTIPNGASNKDIRDTINKALADIVVLQQGATIPAPTIYFDQPTISATEGNSGTKTLTLTLLRSTSVGALAVTANFVQGSAGAADFAGNALPGAKVFTFADGATSATQTVGISGDTDVESDETFGYQLVAPSGYALGSPNSITGTILNDDSAPLPTVTLSAATASANEGGAGTTLAWVYTVTRSTSAGAATVPWSFSAGATNAADWNGGALPTGGNVVFANGETSKAFSLISAGDATVEPDESFSVSIAAPSGYAAGASMSATGTILNDDSATQPITFTSRQSWDADDGFDGGNTQVNQRPGWTATTASQFKTRNSGMYQDSQFGPRRDASFGPVFGPTDNFEVELDWNYEGEGGGSGFEGARQDFRWFRTTDDDTTGKVFSLNPNSVGGNGLGGFMVTSNVDNPAPGTGRTGTGRLRVQAGYIYSKVYGLWCDSQNAFVAPQRTKKTDGIFPIDRYNPAPTSGRVGVGMSTWTYNMLNGIRVRALKIHIIDHQRFVGRRAVGVQEGDVTFNGWAASVPSGARWVYRVMDKNNINQVQDFKDMTGVTVSGTDWSATAAIPFGGPYILEVGYIGPDGIYYSDTSRRVSCGYRWVVYGQSNALGRAGRVSDAASAFQVAGTPAAVSMPEATQWDKNVFFGNETLEFEPSTSMRAAIQLTQSMGNAPCCIITHGQNATGLAGLVPGSFPWQTLKGMVDAGGGIVDGVTWDQGENDSDTNGAGVTSQNAYYTMFKDTMVPGFRDLAKNPNVPIFLAPVGRFAFDGANVNGTVPWSSADPQRDAIKQAKVQLVATAGLNVKFSSSKLGVNHGPDAYHYGSGPDGTIRNTRRDAFSAAKSLGASTADGRGPLITGITRSGATITCDIDLNGAASLGPDFVTFNTGAVPPAQYRMTNDFKGYQVSADNFATLLPVSSIVVSNNKLVITLASAPGGAVKLRSFYGASFDDTQLIYGTYADGRDPIPIFPVWAPLTSN